MDKQKKIEDLKSEIRSLEAECDEKKALKIRELPGVKLIFAHEVVAGMSVEFPVVGWAMVSGFYMGMGTVALNTRGDQFQLPARKRLLVELPRKES